MAARNGTTSAGASGPARAAAHPERRRFMEEAARLATESVEKGWGGPFGAVIVKDGEIVGRGQNRVLLTGCPVFHAEITAIMELAWAQVWERMEGGGAAAAAIEAGDFPPLPRTIDITVDYLRSGLPRDAYARARVNRMGRRYASVHVEAWQDNRARPIAQATGHFLMPASGDG